jgi:hypothetical protein
MAETNTVVVESAQGTRFTVDRAVAEQADLIWNAIESADPHDVISLHGEKKDAEGNYTEGIGNATLQIVLDYLTELHNHASREHTEHENWLRKNPGAKEQPGAFMQALMSNPENWRWRFLRIKKGDLASTETLLRLILAANYLMAEDLLSAATYATGEQLIKGKTTNEIRAEFGYPPLSATEQEEEEERGRAEEERAEEERAEEERAEEERAEEEREEEVSTEEER